MRRRSVRALGLGLSLLIGWAMAGTAPAYASTNSIDWGPSFSNKPRQTLEITGAGFTPGISVQLRECGDLPGGAQICDVKSVVTTTVTADGSFVVGVPVRKVFEGTCGSGCDRKQGRRYRVNCVRDLCDVQAISTDPFTGVSIAWD